VSLGLAANFYREPHALPGFLQMATSGYFDDVVMVSSPPSDAKPDDESIALVEKAGVRLVHTTIDAGYGVVRTRCIRESQAEWTLILDCDERFTPVVPLLRCHGTEGYPQVKNPKLTVEVVQEAFDQGALLKEHLAKCAKETMAFRFSRRHWFGAPGDLTKPCQNWQLIPDWQLRLVRNSPFLFYSPERKMHEHLKYSRTFEEPSWGTGEGDTIPYVDHFHFHFKNLDPEGRKLAVATYEKLDKAGTENMWSKSGF
jgi:hypothetical protein